MNMESMDADDEGTDANTGANSKSYCVETTTTNEAGAEGNNIKDVIIAPHTPAVSAASELDTCCDYDRHTLDAYVSMVYDHPETSQRTREPIVTKVLLIILCVILVFIGALVLIENRRILFDDDTDDYTAPDTLHCHYDDVHFPVDHTCGVGVCDENGIHQRLHLKMGWTESWVHLRKQNADDLLSTVYTSSHVLPDRLYVNTVYDDENATMFENISIALAAIEMDIAWFCCYSVSEYEQIQALFREFYFDAFEVAFGGNYTCLNMTHERELDYMLLLDRDSQRKMKQFDVAWRNIYFIMELHCKALDRDSQRKMKQFVRRLEEYLLYHGVALQSSLRMNGQLYGSKFAVFKDYEPYIENMSVKLLHGLNVVYNEEWNDLSVTVSKHNLELQ
eukprot:CAMPEP_0202734278 /NCGR_PEP_ID=MMETSP1385-20130828/188601_1 /ASSEMBLY_ACC=CAM_ASM_000861 /TAXON_ID=933848 /ORGANISM="Elphidium margaritaceum" /LENGTH=391 /DNA_ID=CAMNT_0049400635 /DNA_START=1 /DNA_END=1177 /DNA_ORIENTATION=+